MLASHTISLDIARTARVVYEYLADPLNYPRWAPVVEGHFEQLEPLTWRVLLPFGERIVRFAPRNDLGILDHSEEPPGGEALLNPMRVFGSDDGCVLIFTFHRRPAMSDSEFASAIEWIRADLWAFKSLIETGVATVR
jgi:hypothetical protein